MTGIDGGTLREWRRSRGWDVPAMARELRKAAPAGEAVPVHDALVRMVRRWEREGLRTERYELLYARALGVPPGSLRHLPGEHDGDSLRPALPGIPAVAVLSLPARLGIGELKHIAAALDDARRYLNADIVGYFAERVSELGEGDGNRGPRETLAPVLGVIAAIDHCGRQVKTGIRRDLLAVGARAAEFAGFLYRDIRAPEHAAYWRDRATEWAQEGGHAALQGYVLLRKSQAAWDDRDALRMLTLAQAAQDDIWMLPPKVRAEAAQQEARGHAMTSGDRYEMNRKLDEASQLLNEPAGGNDPVLGHGYTSALLAMQTAICHGEAGDWTRAADTYTRELTETAFSHRDFGYFSALKAAALAATGNPADACQAGMKALAMAEETSSARTVSEVTRASRSLEQWRQRADVRELRCRLAVVA